MCIDPVSGGQGDSWGNRRRRFSLAPADSVRRHPWTFRRILKGGPGIGLKRSGFASLTSTFSLGTRRRHARSPESDLRFKRGSASAHSAPQRSSSIEGRKGQPPSRRPASSQAPRSTSESTTQRDAETFSTPPTHMRNSRDRRSGSGFGSRMRLPRSIFVIVAGLTRRFRRSVDSSGDSRLPRGIFTFTHLPRVAVHIR